MRVKGVRYLATFPFFALVILMGFVLFSGVSEAQTCPAIQQPPRFGRCIWNGYFDNGYRETGDNVFSMGSVGNNRDGMNTPDVDSFIDTIRDRLSGANAQDRTGAAFIINTMMGIQGASASRTPPNATINEWERRVRAYDTLGWVEWDVSIFYPAESINTYYQTSATTGLGFDDVSHYRMPEAETRYSIRFNNPNGTNYIIKKNCGNPMDAMAALTDVDITYWNYIHDVFRVRDEANTSTIHGQTVAHGDTVRLQSRIRNNGDGSGRSYDLRYRVSTDGGANYTTITTETSLGALGSGSTSPLRNHLYTVPTSLENLTSVCFQAEIRPFRGQSEPTLNSTGHPSGSGTGWRTSTARCVTAYTAPTFSVVPSASMSLDNAEYPTEGTFRGWIDVNIATSGIVDTRSLEVAVSGVLRYYIERSGGAGQDELGTSDYSGSYPSGQTFVVPAFNVDLTAADILFGDQICVTLSATPSAGTIASNDSTVGNGITIPSSPQCIGIAGAPYVSAFGADVIAGNGFVGACESTNIGFIRALFDGDENRYAGSGAQFAVQAMSEVSGFASAKMRTADPQPLKGLTFANTGNTAADGDYGGGFSGLHCVRDWYATSLDVGSIGTISGNLNSVMTAGGTTGNYNLNASQLGGPANVNIPQNSRIVIYRDGNLYLNRNITYDLTSPWGSVNEIPSFYLIVRGDIYISSEVERLDGVYIAQPNASGDGGNIYTCATGIGDQVDIVSNPGVAAAECGNQLTVNGTLIADTVKFNRAFSSQLSGNQAEYVYGPDRQCRVGGGIATGGVVEEPVCAAEIINFSPELFLGPSPFPSGSPSVPRGMYDSIISLPPVL